MAKKSPANELRRNTAAVRVSFSWFGMRKALNAEQRGQAAAPFNAKKTRLSASQQLLDTKHPALSKLVGLKGDIVAYWRSHTLPYTEDGVRLLPRDQVGSFNSAMQVFAERFTDAVKGLEAAYVELKEQAKQDLGDLYAEGNYPKSVAGEFAFFWSFPSVEPPEYLQTLSPKLYEQERQRIAAQFTEAATLAHQALTAELAKLVTHMAEKLAPNPDGSKKTFRDSTVENLTEFFERFNKLNVTGQEDVEDLVKQAKALVAGHTAQELRDSDQLRQEIAAGLAKVSDQLNPLVVNAPRRKILPIEPNGGAQSTSPSGKPASSVSESSSKESPAIAPSAATNTESPALTATASSTSAMP